MAGEGAPDSSSSSESLSQGAEIPVQCLEAALVPATRTELLGGEGGKRRRQEASPGRLPCGPLNLGGVRAAGRGGREEEKAGREPWTAALRPLESGWGESCWAGEGPLGVDSVTETQAPSYQPEWSKLFIPRASTEYSPQWG